MTDRLLKVISVLSTSTLPYLGPQEVTATNMVHGLQAWVTPKSSSDPDGSEENDRRHFIVTHGLLFSTWQGTYNTILLQLGTGNIHVASVQNP